MESIVQFTAPIVKIYSKTDSMTPYHVFSKDSQYTSGTNLLSYTYSRSINNLEGQFQLTFKESLDTSDSTSKFYNNVSNLDVVAIYENDKLQFLGVITNKSYTAMISGFQKTISISGRSIEYLFSFLNISFNVTAMAFNNLFSSKEMSSMSTKWSLSKGEEPLTVKRMLTESFDEFCNVAKGQSTISNTTIIEMINSWYGSSSEIFEVPSGMDFSYPIQSNLFNDEVCNFFNYARGLLPNNVYEIFGIIKNNKPKLMVREVPFDNKDWKSLESTPIYPISLTGYTLTRSIDEVYTSFYSFIEGSSFDQSFYENMQAIKNDSKDSESYAKTIQEKVNIYGYVPLRVNFCGFNISKAENETVTNNLSTTLKNLNQRIANWYGALDEMYDANITTVLCNDYKSGAVGEKINFLDGEFYITGIEHAWNFGGSIKVTYHCERGGSYDNAGNFTELKDITRRMGELKNE